MICGVESGILSDPINGCNVIDKEYCKSSNTIKKYLCESLHIPDDLIDVKSVGGCLHNSWCYLLVKRNVPVCLKYDGGAGLISQPCIKIYI